MSNTSYNRHEDPRYGRLIELLTQHSVVSPRAAAKGIVISVLTWTAYNAPSGDLSVFSPQVIATAIEWEGDADLLLSMLQEAGFLDANRRFVRLQEMFKANEKMIHWMEQ